MLFISSTLLVFLLVVSSFNFTFAQENQNVDFAEQSSFLIETIFWDETQFCEETENILQQKGKSMEQLIWIRRNSDEIDEFIKNSTYKEDPAKNIPDLHIYLTDSNFTDTKCQEEEYLRKMKIKKGNKNIPYLEKKILTPSYCTIKFQTQYLQRCI